jgi:glycine hydroxymethyltransferase
MTLVGNLIADVLEAPSDASVIATVRSKVEALTARFPVYR